jgi:hypothetical protein
MTIAQMIKAIQQGSLSYYSRHLDIIGELLTDKLRPTSKSLDIRFTVMKEGVVVQVIEKSFDEYFPDTELTDLYYDAKEFLHNLKNELLNE